ncbi:DUF1697 domain-containing protein [Cohnella silvisoli]|uniref:DUF1697 domain-containing protein n=1 Tax=Cohnella silvisoli TaxID=2873699 RepID=A0ABV1KVL4_9BACL|nr:DUF1697 domain-containing protein [Cohnella silvisoli]MCD9023557.1 DUF1697 domain-containing protein [Cohnella silvisoli]
MTIYIALIRGINVGGKNKVPMAELKLSLQAIGLNNVQTYIQSGNVLFESEDGAEQLRGRIEQAIEASFGVTATVVLRTAEQLERIIEGCPYAADSLLEGESIQVSVLTEAPSQKAIDILSVSSDEKDEYQISGEEIYFLFRQSVLDSKLAKNLAKLGSTVTSRNWNTIIKLGALVKAMEG